MIGERAAVVPSSVVKKSRLADYVLKTGVDDDGIDNRDNYKLIVLMILNDEGMMNHCA